MLRLTKGDPRGFDVDVGAGDTTRFSNIALHREIYEEALNTLSREKARIPSSTKDGQAVTNQPFRGIRAP